MGRVPTSSVPHVRRTLPRWMRGGSRRRRTILITLLVLVAALVALAIPLLAVPGDAQAAKEDLSAAKVALQAGDTASAGTSVVRARDHIDSAQDGTQGLGGDVWSRIPVLGTPVADARHLVQALDDATAVAEIGVDLYPLVAGKHATLFRDGQAERQTLDRVIAGAREAGAHLTSAEDELTQVRGSTPFVGASIAARRDEAADQVIPLAEGFTRLEPLLDELPGFLGFEGKRNYVIAMLNPAELRYSGGAALAFAPMTSNEGALEIGKAFSLSDDPRLTLRHTWRKVKGNKFHRSDTRLANSTFAPSWSVSGRELLRAWRSATGRGFDGVLAVDVVATAKVLAATGPTTVPGIGKLTGDNLAKVLVGSYDDYYPDPADQDQTFATVVASLQQRLFTGGGYVAKAKALGDATDGRHLALFMQDPDIQAGFAALGLDASRSPLVTTWARSPRAWSAPRSTSTSDGASTSTSRSAGTAPRPTGWTCCCTTPRRPTPCPFPTPTRATSRGGPAWPHPSSSRERRTSRAFPWQGSRGTATRKSSTTTPTWQARP
jgi:hypothetical protein